MIENEVKSLEKLNEYLPYIVSVIVALISGFTSFVVSTKKNKADMKALQESNVHEINRLMEQHKLDIDSLKQKHEMEIERMELEHKHQMELKNKEAENAMGSDLLNTVIGAAIQTPEAKQAMGQAFRGQAPHKRRHR